MPKDKSKSQPKDQSIGNPKDTTILILGAGPTTIGQSGECDQGAVEACIALREKGYRLIAVTSNPDAIMADTDVAHTSYIEPLDLDTLTEIIATEKPHAILNLFGGRDGLDLSVKLDQSGILGAHGVSLWGTPTDALNCILDRDALQEALGRIEAQTPALYPVEKESEATEKAQDLGYPVVLRCDDPSLIPDGLLVYNQEELADTLAPIAGEPTCKVSVETSMWDLHQVELEILRDSRGLTVLAGMVEFIDPAGIHPGDCIGVCPAQTLSEFFCAQLFREACKIAEYLRLIGSATLRFAYKTDQGAVLVLAVHPRYTRTSALVSRTTGLPLAKLASLLAAGFSMDQVFPQRCDTPATPPKPYVIGVKWPVWPFKALDLVSDRLGPRMQATGQAFGFGATCQEALQKAARGATSAGEGFLRARIHARASSAEVLQAAASACSENLFILFQALVQGAELEKVGAQSHIHPWFLEQLKSMADLQGRIQSVKDGRVDQDLLREAKAAGFSHRHLADLLGRDQEEIADQLERIGCHLSLQPLSAGDSPALQYYGTYGPSPNFAAITEEKTVLILGSGVHDIGQGAENDYGLFHAAKAAKALGYTPITINPNFASVTAGSGMEGRFYCEPLDLESVDAIVRREKPVGMVTEFSGQTQSGLIDALQRRGLRLMGTGFSIRRLLKDRPAWRAHLRRLGIPQPTWALVHSREELEEKSREIGFPLLVYFNGARGYSRSRQIMDQTMLDTFIADHAIDAQRPAFLEQFIEYAIEAQAEAVCDGRKAFVAAVLEHIELAGVNATDSACVLPPYSIAPRHVETMTAYVEKIAADLGICGMLNVRFALYRDSVFVLEAAIGICRNLGIVSKAIHLPVARLITGTVLGQSLAEMTIPARPLPYFCIRSAVFPFRFFPDLDPLLGPKMRATGQVMAFGDSFGRAYFKSHQAAGAPLPTEGCVLITVTDEDKASILEPARIFQEMGFALMATKGTQSYLTDHGLQARLVKKLGFGRPHLVDEIKNGKVQMVINTPSGEKSQKDDSYIRKAATRQRIANITTPASSVAAAKGIAARRKGTMPLRALQGYAQLLPRW